MHAEAPSAPHGGPALDTWERNARAPALLAAIGLIAPHLAAVLVANELAAHLDPIVTAWAQGVEEHAREAAPIVSMLLTGRFGLLVTAPLLLVWTIPTVVLHSTSQALFAESGLLGRMAALTHPLVARWGLSGDDLVRVTMGFGCNVPAVMAASRCTGCSRDACTSAISFGAACSYQLGATLSVFAAAQSAWLAPAYLLYLVVTMLLFVRFSTGGQPREVAASMRAQARLCVPQPRLVVAAVRTTLAQFLQQALPVFVLFSTAASLLDAYGMFAAMGRRLAPALGLLGLPGEAAAALVMAAVRKDGILLLAPLSLTPGQLLVATYLASTLTPCLVTAWAIVRTRSAQATATLLAKQAAAALSFSALLAALAQLSSWI